MIAQCMVLVLHNEFCTAHVVFGIACRLERLDLCCTKCNFGKLRIDNKRAAFINVLRMFSSMQKIPVISTLKSGFLLQRTLARSSSSLPVCSKVYYGKNIFAERPFSHKYPFHEIPFSSRRPR